jgi:hypothetical protein
VSTGVTPDARELVLQDATGEEPVRDLADPTGRHGPYSRAKRSSYTVCSRCT